VKDLKNYLPFLIPLLSALVFVGVAYGTVTSKTEELEGKVTDLIVIDKAILSEQKTMSHDITTLKTQMEYLIKNTDKILDKLETR